MGVRGDSSIRLVRGAGTPIAEPITKVPPAKAGFSPEMTPGNPSGEAISMGWSAVHVRSATNPTRLEREFRAKIEPLGTQKALRAGDVSSTLAKPARIGKRSYKVIADYVDAPTYDRKQYALWFMDEDFDFEEQDFFDGVRFGVTLGNGESISESDDFSLRAHFEDGTKPEEIKQAVEFFEHWLRA